MAESPASRGLIDPKLLSRVEDVVARFRSWLDRFGETSYDFQTVYAGPWGRTAKALYYRKPWIGTFAVAPMVACEAFVPAARRYFWIRQRFPIADAHFAMGFALLFQRHRRSDDYRCALHFLQVLLDTRCQTGTGYSWGYPFDWETVTGTIKAGTPLITTTPYAYEAFSEVHAADGEERWIDVMRSIAEHVYSDYRDLPVSQAASSATYTPDPTDRGRIVNASAYRAFVLTDAGVRFGEDRYLERARRNVNFVVESQHGDGSWPYAVDGQRNFVDHIHTCFVLKALAKIQRLVPSSVVDSAIGRGVGYYVTNLFDDHGMPRPFAKPPRLVFYRRELYDYAESINLCLLLAERSPELQRLLITTVSDLADRWQQSSGAFRTRQLWFGWDNVPMHRWAQAQTFRSLCLLLRRCG